MSSTLTVKPRRFRITLWEASEDFSPIKELTEVVTVTTNFSVGQIPMASVNLPAGEEVESGKPAKTPKEIAEMVANRTPLCIQVLRTGLPLHATHSTPNDTDPECKWPETPVIIFKGYAAAYSFYKNGTETGITVNIQHWLCDLASVSAYCPRSHCTNPAAFAIDINTFRLQPELNNTNRHWTVLSTTLSSVMNNAAGTVWGILDKIFRRLCKASLEMNDTAIGAISEKYVKRMENALDKFIPHLAWHPKIIASVDELSNCIVAAIGSSVASAWTNTTIWDEANGSMAGMFYYSIAPTVDNAHVIPRPGAVGEDCIELNRDDLISFSMDIPTMPILDACILAYQNGTEHVASEPSFVLGPMHPERRDTETALYATKGGPVAVTSMPVWMQNRVIMYAMQNQDHICSLHKPLGPTPGMATPVAKEVGMDAAVETIGRQLVKFDYFSQVFSGRMVRFSMPFRADICPGACVHIKIDPVVKTKYEDDIDVYGTVASVTLNVEPPNASTTIVLTNIRSKPEYESDTFNGGPVFYEEIWSGKGVPLYSES